MRERGTSAGREEEGKKGGSEGSDLGNPLSATEVRDRTGLNRIASPPLGTSLSKAEMTSGRAGSDTLGTPLTKGRTDQQLLWGVGLS